jgi:hypothetical protein
VASLQPVIRPARTPDQLAGEADGGIGFFHDVWTIIDIPLSDAAALVAYERSVAAVIDELASTPSDFERLAAVAEYGLVDDWEDITAQERAALEGVVSDMPEIEGLDLGVAGLVHALASVGLVPAASCRSHVGKPSWSPFPVVLCAATEAQARTLQPPVQQ